MRRSRLVQLFGGAVLAASLILPSVAMAANEPTTTTLPTIPLACDLVLQNPLGTGAPREAIVCTWSAPALADVTTYRLWRVVDAPNPASRTMVAAIAAAEPLRYADTAIRAGHRYSYHVVGIGSDGKRVALSAGVTVRFVRPVEQIAMSCEMATAGALSGVSCHWAASTRPAATRYVLVRSVDGAARERIYRTWIDGKRTFLDTNVTAGQSIKYAVLALAADGRVVGRGGAVVITIPAASN